MPPPRTAAGAPRSGIGRFGGVLRARWQPCRELRGWCRGVALRSLALRAMHLDGDDLGRRGFVLEEAGDFGDVVRGEAVAASDPAERDSASPCLLLHPPFGTFQDPGDVSRQVEDQFVAGRFGSQARASLGLCALVSLVGVAQAHLGGPLGAGRGRLRRIRDIRGMAPGRAFGGYRGFCGRTRGIMTPVQRCSVGRSRRAGWRRGGRARPATVCGRRLGVPVPGSPMQTASERACPPAEPSQSVDSRTDVTVRLRQRGV